MKKWFEMINDTPLTIEQEISIDFVESQDEDG